MSAPQIRASVVEDSVSDESGIRLTTMQLAYPRLVHSEFLTHRAFSRNASSSRAIPVAKVIEQVRNRPAMPVHWGANQPGMQAREQVANIDGARALWRKAASDSADTAEAMMAMGLHKQVANRILEPFQIIHVIVTATEWGNFFELRHHEDADPNIFELARVMRQAYRASIPVGRGADRDKTSSWHLPYVTRAERDAHPHEPRYLAKLSAARCARVSYLTHDGQQPDPVKDIALYDRLVGSRPLHASPVEHQACPDREVHSLTTTRFLHPELHGNLRGWIQHRKIVEKEMGL